MRGSFVLNATQSRVAHAVMHVAAPGCAVVTVNGKAVDSGVGICTWTQFQHTVLYSTRASPPAYSYLHYVLGCFKTGFFCGLKLQNVLVS